MRILLAVDGSHHSLEAARAVHSLAPADLLLVLHVVQTPHTPYLTDYDRFLYDEMEGRLRQHGEELVNQTTALLPHDIGPTRGRVTTGTPAEVILSTAEWEQIDLIVMGARGLSPIEELVLGSVSHHVVTRAHCPTLVIKRPLPSVHRVLLALQDQDDAQAAVKFLEKHPFRKPIQITVLTCPPTHRPYWPIEVPISEPHLQKARDNATKFVEDVSSKLTAMDYVAEGAVKDDAPVTAILHTAQEMKADLILLGTHGKKGFDRIALGSVAHAVLHKAPCPVLNIRIACLGRPGRQEGG